ncbi:MAG: glycosyltransferase [Actinomycetota bacterium]|nr:MAG: glycosyltransferase [Actinomycetota bacterium]
MHLLLASLDSAHVDAWTDGVRDQADVVDDPELPALAIALAALGDDVTVVTRRSGARRRGTQVVDAVTVERVVAGPTGRTSAGALIDHVGQYAEGLGDRIAAGRPDAVVAMTWVAGLAVRAAVAGTTVACLQRLPDLASAGGPRGVASAESRGVPSGLASAQRGARAATVLPAKERRTAAAEPAEHPARARLELAVARAADHCLPRSAADAHRLHLLGVPLGRVTVLGPGVSPCPWHEVPPRLSRDPLHVAVPVAATDRGAVALALAAASRSPRVHLDLQLLGPWETSDLADISARVDRLGLHDVVSVTRVSPGDPGWIPAADVVCLLTGAADGPAIALHAMACGAPVVAVAAGALDDVVVDGVTGRTIREGDLAGLTRALRELSNDVLREAMGAAARDRARASYGWERLADTLHRTTEQVLGARSAPGRGATRTPAAAGRAGGGTPR